MCGILGLVSGQRLTHHDVNVVLDQEQQIAVRGPDSNGSHISEHSCLVHTRLAIQDVSSRGSQPMTSSCGRYTLIYNGEIYNHVELRQRFLSLVPFNSDSDTEVLLHLLSRKGVREVIDLIDGMYAFAFIDHHAKKLTLARDLYGQKPLYFCINERSIAFSSSLTAVKNIVTSCGESIELNKNAVLSFAELGFVQQPSTIWKGINQVRRNSCLVVDYSREQLTRRYINHEHNCNRPLGSPSRSLEDSLEIAVKSCLIADVPVGVLLSGGIDSSLVAAVARRQGALKSFALGFDEKAYDESSMAERIAVELGTDHETIKISPADVLRVAQILPTVFEEPLADPSIIPMIALCERTSQKVKVALTGDGGDELFYGYNRHIYSALIENRPRLTGIAQAISSLHVPDIILDPFFNILGVKTASEKIEKLALMRSALIKKDYLGVISGLPETQSSLLAGYQESTSLADYVRDMDVEVYQQSCTLVKSDRTSMHSGLELRAPFLQGPVLEYVRRSVSPATEIRGLTGKSSLREIAYKLVDKKLLDRPKAGFASPIKMWFSGPLEAWSEQGIKKLNNSSLSSFLPSATSRLSKTHNLAHQKWRLSILGHWVNANATEK